MEARLILPACLLLIGGLVLAADKPETPESPKSADATRTAPLEAFQFQYIKGREQVVLGKVQLTAQDGGLLVLGQDGGLWTVEPSQLIGRKGLGKEFAPLDAAELGKLLQAERGGDRFQILTTKHYVLCFNTTREYAQWCGSLFERLYTGFHNYWKQRGITLHEPQFPLVALIFADQKQFAAFATRDAGPEAAVALGYYAIGSNRMVMYDQISANGKPARTLDEIQRRFAAAPNNIATVVHEATHQIAFNSGMHVRYADNPLWLTEGMAMFFETPDLKSRSGWASMGAVNPPRLKRFRANLAKRSTGSIAALIQSDEQFTNSETMPDAYAEAWALTYFLARTRKEAYVEYLKKLAAKKVLNFDKPADRLAEFRAAFGDDLQSLERDFLKHMRGVK